MSVRPNRPQVQHNGSLQAELEEMRRAAVRGDETSEPLDVHDGTPLTSVEMNVASLGVDPSAWKPISFMNTAHYEKLLEGNHIDSAFAQKLEAYKAISES